MGEYDRTISFRLVASLYPRTNTHRKIMKIILVRTRDNNKHRPSSMSLYVRQSLWLFYVFVIAIASLQKPTTVCAAASSSEEDEDVCPIEENNHDPYETMMRGGKGSDESNEDVYQKCNDSPLRFTIVKGGVSKITSCRRASLDKTLCSADKKILSHCPVACGSGRGSSSSSGDVLSSSCHSPKTRYCTDSKIQWYHSELGYQTCESLDEVSDDIQTLCTKFDGIRDTCRAVCRPYFDLEVKRTIRKLQAGRKPNILLILADDVGTGNLPFWWNWPGIAVAMPNLQRLTNMGLKFMDAHSHPVCAPTRYMLLSGNYAYRGKARYGAWNLDDGYCQFHRGQRSIADVLRKGANYHTAMFGKAHLGGKVPPNGVQDKKHLLTSKLHDWTQPLIGGPQTYGFDYSYITTAGIGKPPYAFFKNGYLDMDVNTEVRGWQPGAYRWPSGVSYIFKGDSGEGILSWDASGYNKILVNQTIDFVERHQVERPNDPFFAYVALGAVHQPHSPPDQWFDGTPIACQHPTRHMDMLAEMDKVIGTLVTYIENEGMANDTIIIFTSDNGGLSGTEAHTLCPDTAYTGLANPSGPLQGSKRSIYEGGHRVPLIIRGDNRFPAGEIRDRLVGLSDIYATICEIVGIPIPYGSAVDSISFASYLHSQANTATLRTTLTTTAVADIALRYGNKKLIYRVKQQEYKLYDLGTDLSERNNLFNKLGKYQKKQLLKKLQKTGPCPTDSKSKFLIYSRTPQAYTVGCKYFKQNPKLCNEHWEGEQYCNSICGRYKDGEICKCIKKSDKKACKHLPRRTAIGTNN